jgi:DNA-binding CsgD family transcriptional regulator
MLPPALRGWLLRSAPTGTAGALLVEHESGSLQVTVVARVRDGTCSLLLDEREDSAAAARLMELGLTPREAEVLIWVARGKTSSEIAVILNSKMATISKHLDHIYQKLGVENRTSAAAYVTRL